MRVAIIDDAGFGWGRPGLFGKELYVELLARGLERFGIEVVRVLLSGSLGNNWVSVRGSDLPIIRVFFDPRLEHDLARILSNADIVHVNVLNARYPRHIIKITNSLKKPLVVTMHSWAYLCPTGWVVKMPKYQLDEDPRLRPQCIRCLWSVGRYYGFNPVWFTLDGFNRVMALQGLLKRASAIISPSRLLADKVRELLRLDNVHHIPNPVPDDLLALKPNYGGDGSLAFFARLSHEKGAHLIPEIARRLSGVIIHVMGDGYLRDYIIGASRKYGNIVYHGFVSNEEKVKIVSNSSLVIMPINWVELYSYTVVESFAMGKPVVSFGVGGPKELIEDSGAGLLARPFDVDDFISKVRYLLGNEDLVRDMGVRGRSFVEKLTVDSYVKRVLEIYREVSH